MTSTGILYYVTDPMCSWCWGFHEQLELLRAGLPAGVQLQYVLGGLAPDSDAPMPEETRQYVQEAWRAVQARTGARFNWDFWERCEPRRSTYPACRAVIAAGEQDATLLAPMFEALQRAYYLEARNPSLARTLVEVAGELGLDRERFEHDLNSAHLDATFRQHRDLRDRLGARGYPSLIFEDASGALHPLMQGAGTAQRVLVALQTL